jgi:Zn-finger nucleic acid-binding protein
MNDAFFGNAGSGPAADGSEDGVKVQGEASQQACPLCKMALVSAGIAGIPILYCTGCHGVLAPMQTMQSLVSELQAQTGARGTGAQAVPNKGDSPRTIGCPRCHRRMDAHFYAGPGNVMIDSCEDCCLVWLDRGELSRIASASSQPVSYIPPPPGDTDPLFNYEAEFMLRRQEYEVDSAIVDGIDSFLQN